MVVSEITAVRENDAFCRHWLGRSRCYFGETNASRAEYSEAREIMGEVHSGEQRLSGRLLDLAKCDLRLARCKNANKSQASDLPAGGSLERALSVLDKVEPDDRSSPSSSGTLFLVGFRLLLGINKGDGPRTESWQPVHHDEPQQAGDERAEADAL